MAADSEVVMDVLVRTISSRAFPHLSLSCSDQIALHEEMMEVLNCRLASFADDISLRLTHSLRRSYWTGLSLRKHPPLPHNYIDNSLLLGDPFLLRHLYHVLVLSVLPDGIR